MALQLTAKAYVLDVQYEKDFQTDVVTRVAGAFIAHRIKRPLFLNYAATDSDATTGNNPGFQASQSTIE